MQKIYFLIEKNGEKLLEYINEIDNLNTEIHIYDSIIESCEKNLFYLAGELFSIFCENALKCSVITDVKEIYELASSIYYPFFNNIEYIEQNVKKRFEYDIDYLELLKFESGIFQNGSEKDNINLIIKTLKVKELYGYSDLMGDLQFECVTKTDKTIEFYIHICRTLMGANENGKVFIDKFMMIFLKSILMKLEKKCENTNDLLKYYIDNISDAEYDYFIWNQIKRGNLTGEIEMNAESFNLHDYIYKRCFEKCRDELVDVNNSIPYSERNKNVVIVMSIQYLSERHAPTKTIMERCKTLKDLGKVVIFINTTEQYNVYGCIPYFHMFCGNVLEEYSEISELDMKGEKIGFCQMKELQSIREKYDIIRQLIEAVKPEYILSIGTGSILADLCSYTIPCAEMALTFSTLPHTENCIPILGRKMTEEEKKEAKRDIIESRFTFELNEQKNKITREQLKIPQHSFVLLVVGIRLDYEITDDFLKILCDCCDNGCYVVFAGVYEKYEQHIEKFTKLKASSKFIGYCKDMLALCEICDLYVNPERVGGGFSVIEAFSKGKPGIYLKRGDVYTSGGKEFAVDTLGDMYIEIIKYKNNKQFYEQKAMEAKKRAMYMTSSLEAMREIDKEIIKRVKGD